MRKSTVIVLALVIFLLNSLSVFAEQAKIYLFHGETCPHCVDEIEFLDRLLEDHKDWDVNVNKYEVWNNEENMKLMEHFAASFDFEVTGVPLTFIGDKYWVGFGESNSETLREAIEAEVKAENKTDTADIVDGLIKTDGGVMMVSDSVTLPFVGKVDLTNKSSLLVTLIIGLADGVNPCSLWVLTMFLAIVLHTKSRKKSLIVGAVYITITAAIYALFILGIFKILDYSRYIKQIQIITAVITLIMGAINIKDYFFYKKGVSLTIDDNKKPVLYEKMRNIVKNSDSLPAMIGATAALAVMVSFVEFSCTAAFPVIWSNILTSQGVTGPAFWSYLIIYMLLYQLDEIVIFLVAVVTMKSKRFEEKHGRFLKLLSGCMMFALSLIMIISPEMMNNLSNVLVVFSSVILITFSIHAFCEARQNR